MVPEMCFNGFCPLNLAPQWVSWLYFHANLDKNPSGRHSFKTPHAWLTISIEGALIDLNTMSCIIKNIGLFWNTLWIWKIYAIFWKASKKPDNCKKGFKIFPLFLVCHEYLWVKFIPTNVFSAVWVLIVWDSFLLEDKITLISFNKYKIELRIV
jgi:hypothetical protein